MKSRRTLLTRDPYRYFAEPVLRVSASGETLEANAAFRELTERCGVKPVLSDLFGPAIGQLFAQTKREGWTRALLPIMAGPEPRPMFRVSLYRGAEDGSLAVLLIDVSEEVAVRRQLFERNHVLTVLNDVGAALGATLDPDVLAERIYEQVGRIMRVTTFYMSLHDRETNRVTFPLYVEERMKSEAAARPFTNGLTEYVIRTGRPLLLNSDVEKRASALGIEPVGRPCRSWIGVPIPGGDGACGVLALQDFERTECFTLHDLEVLTIVAAQAGVAIRNAHLFASARQVYRELSETQARLLESERLRGVTETVGALNHEINNPLAAIAGNAQLLLRNPESLSTQTRMKLESILEAARRIQRVTAKMSSLIQATTMPYPGEQAILDVRRSVARDEPGEEPGTEEPAA
jgi:GAF domain-containing protein